VSRISQLFRRIVSFPTARPSGQWRPSRPSGQWRPSLEVLDDRITPTVSSIVSNFNGTAIQAGSTLWFNSVMKVSGLGSNPVTVRVTDASVSSQYFNVAVPSAAITFAPGAGQATTVFDPVYNTWYTTVPTGLGGNTFLDGAAFPVPSGGLRGGINPVTWTANFTADTPGVTVSWQWSAAVYRTFSTDLPSLGVKPVDSNSASQYRNSDHAGTPENFKRFVTGGARGGGGSNFTGSYSATKSVTPDVCNPPPPASPAPSGGTASLSGTVYVDVNFDNRQDAGEGGIVDVIIRLTGTDNLGQAVALETTTDGDGHYSFTGLQAGTYQLFEVQPIAYLQGGVSVGTVNGATRGSIVGTDLIGGIVLGAGEAGVMYDFGEVGGTG
jgi:SdrD B-like domain